MEREHGATTLSAGLTLDEVRDAVGMEVPDGPYETLAGFLLARLGRLAEPSDTVTHLGWRIEVLAVTGRRIDKVRVVEPAEEQPR